MSTPRASSTSTQEIQATDTYHQIIPGMSECLYPTLVADSLLSTSTADNCSTLQRQITSELDKYLQEATEKHERDDNYYDGWHMATNTSNPQQEVNFLEEDNDAGSDEEGNNAIIPESHGQDTSTHYDSPPKCKNQPQDELDTIPEEEEPQAKEQPYLADIDIVVFTSDESEEEAFNTVQSSFSSISLVVHKCILQHWGMLQECTLVSYRVLHSSSIKYITNNTCVCCKS